MARRGQQVRPTAAEDDAIRRAMKRNALAGDSTAQLALAADRLAGILERRTARTTDGARA